MTQETHPNDQRPAVTIYTDGGADPNPGYGGWGAILQFGENEKELSGSAPKATNNRMELQAAISALEALKRPCVVNLYTDSQYLKRGISEWIEGWAEKGWRKKDKPIPNADLWQKLWVLTKKHEIEWHWVKGHAGNELNERVDELATQARLAITPQISVDETIPRLFVRASCKGNPGPGGWGVVLEMGQSPNVETEQLSGSAASTTNNRMELTAVIEGLKLLPAGEPVQVMTISDYVYQGATNWINGWRARQWQKKDGTAVANADLWQIIESLRAQHQIKWINVKGAKKEFVGLQEAETLAKSAVV